MFRSFAIALLLAMVGCASQSDIDQLRKEVDQLKKARVENQEKLEKAMNEADAQLNICNWQAQSKFDEDWKLNSTPGKNGSRWGDPSIINHLKEEMHREEVECQRGYENAIQKAKLLYGS